MGGFSYALTQDRLSVMESHPKPWTVVADQMYREACHVGLMDSTGRTFLELIPMPADADHTVKEIMAIGQEIVTAVNAHP